MIMTWVEEYNSLRPHRGLRMMQLAFARSENEGGQ